ncbi:MAG: flavodoxin family protein [Kiritimatiellae bacterium]|nr:flavodoxin family protein [Kiritimatiellia bacterium]MDD5520066.1 flavodoxin family protein [Kiritimatiellia bacterium]
MKRVSNKTKIVILQGSPNAKGNTVILADEIARGAVTAGAKVEKFFLQNLNIASCNACQSCQEPKAKGCVIDDDMDEIYKATLEADAIVFACPIYWFTMSAQLKQVMDRFYAFVTPDGGHRFAGKRIGLAFTFGGDDLLDSGCINAIRAFQDAFAYIKAPITGMVYGSTGAGSIRKNKALMRKALELGHQLAAK